MSQIAVLGSTGMIGLGVTKELSALGYQVTEFNRSGVSVAKGNLSQNFDILRIQNPRDLDCLSGFEYIINLSGVIRHKIQSSDGTSVQNAIRINSLFPHVLDTFAASRQLRVIQIGTDCVFSGRRGSYLERDEFDPVDLYGFSKVVGEMSLRATKILRVSIVGRESHSAVELMEWVLGQKPHTKVRGFTNHIWNGITPLHFARILMAVIENDFFVPDVQHVVPSNVVSKAQLIGSIADIFERTDLRIEEHVTDKVDRSLGTVDEVRNLNLWQRAGYETVPTIETMIEEYRDWLQRDLS